MIERKYFVEVKDFLEGHLPGKIESIGGSLLYVNSEEKDGLTVMIDYDETEAKIGIGSVFESHFLDDTKIEQVVWRFLTILTKDIQIINYYKGKFHYKTKFELVSNSGEIESFGTTIIWLYPFWKKDRHEYSSQKAVLRDEEIESRFESLKNN